MVNSLEQHAALVAALAEGLDARVFETHISSVLVAGGEAWKLKKPVDFGFLDFSSLEKRQHCCGEEIRLNSRIAPDIYKDVAVITGSPEAPELNGEGDAIEYAVHMREFPADSLLADHHELLDEHAIDDIARQVALFQRDIAVAEPDGEFGAPDAVYFPMGQNFDQVRALISDPGDLARLDSLESWTRAQFERLYGLIQKRLDAGFIREGHGDMHLGNIAVEEGSLISFDGIEFNPNLRWIDNINEIAFLMMDLDRIQRGDLAQRFLNSWLDDSGDFEGLPLLRFYQAYRAMVRTKIAAIRLSQELSEEERASVTEAYREYLALAESYTRPHQPQMIITCGVSGSGKSVAAANLMTLVPAVRIRSDVERKRLAGLAPLDKSKSGVDDGIYTPEMSRKTYQRLLDLSETVIKADFSAIADATFMKQAHREPFLELAERLGVEYRILAMDVPEDELRGRVEARLKRGDDPAEADISVLEKQLKEFEPLTADETGHAIAIRPDSQIEASILN